MTRLGNNVGMERGKFRLLLLTGAPGVGKTTIVQAVAREMAPGSVRGFYTEEIRERGTRQGFRLVPFGGETRVLAHADFESHLRVGKYGVDVDMLDEVMPSLLAPDPAASLYLIDEIGKMECLSRRFVASMRELLDARQPVIATVGQRGEGFIAEVKRRPDATMWQVTRANREALPQRVVEWIENHVGHEPGSR